MGKHKDISLEILRGFSKNLKMDTSVGSLEILGGALQRSIE